MAVKERIFRLLLAKKELTRQEIAGLRELLAPLSQAARLQRYPMLLGREDIIIAGLTIYLALADLLGAAEFVASDAGLLDGLLLAGY